MKISIVYSITKIRSGIPPETIQGHCHQDIQKQVLQMFLLQNFSLGILPTSGHSNNGMRSFCTEWSQGMVKLEVKQKLLHGFSMFDILYC